LAIGEVVVVLEELQFQHQDGFFGGAAPIGAVIGGDGGAKTLEIDCLPRATEVMLRRNEAIKHLQIDC
jgi:hypothetical protein